MAKLCHMSNDVENKLAEKLYLVNLFWGEWNLWIRLGHFRLWSSFNGNGQQHLERLEKWMQIVSRWNLFEEKVLIKESKCVANSLVLHFRPSYIIHYDWLNCTWSSKCVAWKISSINLAAKKMECFTPVRPRVSTHIDMQLICLCFCVTPPSL